MSQHHTDNGYYTHIIVFGSCMYMDKTWNAYKYISISIVNGIVSCIISTLYGEVRLYSITISFFYFPCCYLLQLASILDLFPTFANIVGGKIPTDRRMDGYDMAPILYYKQDVRYTCVTDT